MLVRQLEEELRLRLRQPAPELQQQLESIYAENEHLQREIAILRDTIKVREKDIVLSRKLSVFGFHYWHCKDVPQGNVLRPTLSKVYYFKLFVSDRQKRLRKNKQINSLK